MNSSTPAASTIHTIEDWGRTIWRRRRGILRPSVDPPGSTRATD